MVRCHLSRAPVRSIATKILYFIASWTNGEAHEHEKRKRKGREEAEVEMEDASTGSRRKEDGDFVAEEGEDGEDGGAREEPIGLRKRQKIEQAAESDG